MAEPKNFCTLFDVNFLPRGLVLYSSLRDVSRDSVLRVYCMDDETKRLLDQMRLPGLIAVGVDDLEEYDPHLRAVKSTRSHIEYAWTATPVVCLHALETEPHLDLITYVDADVMFFESPAVIFEELGDRSILLTPHGTPPGGYIVQFMPFRRDETGLAALRWWRARCLEWCYDRAEDDKFGDQAYLNDWPERFSGGVRVLRHPGAAVGPWNADRSSLERRDGRLTVKGQPLIFYHYSTIRLYRGPLTAIPRRGFLSGYYRSTPGVDSFVWATPFDIPPTMRRLVFDPYIKRLADALDDIRRVEPSFAAGIAPLSVSNLAYHAVRGLLPRRVRVAVRRLIGDRVYAAVRRPFYRPS